MSLFSAGRTVLYSIANTLHIQCTTSRTHASVKHGLFLWRRTDRQGGLAHGLGGGVGGRWGARRAVLDVRHLMLRRGRRRLLALLTRHVAIHEPLVAAAVEVLGDVEEVYDGETLTTRVKKTKLT